MKKFLLIVTILFFNQNVSAEIIVFKDCDSNEYQCKKNKYTLDLEKKEMTREFIYSDESFKKLR